MALNEKEHQFCTFMLQHYLVTGAILSAEAALENFGLPVGTYTACIQNPEVVAALEERGIIFQRLGSDWSSQSLTAIQLIVANSMLDLVDTRSQKKKLQDLGVSTHTYDAWLRDPVFKEYLMTRAENLLGDNGHEAHLALLDKVRSGDTKAITLYYELTGRYVKETNSNSAAAVLRALLFVLLRLLTTLYRIHEKLRRSAIN